VGAADPAQRSAFLAAGISQALNTTAFGLIVAVPTLLLHGFLASKVEAVVESVDETAVRLIQTIVGKSGTGNAAPARSRTAQALEKQGV
jgi:biopolymer transport protein ExbB